MTPRPQSWSLIVFGYNEAATVGSVVEDAEKLLAEICPGKGEVIAIDDGSTDGSAAILDGLAQRYANLKVVRHGRNLGIGHALRSGYAAATGENCCAVPADGQFDLAEIRPYARLPRGTFVSFTRQAKTGYSRYRQLLTAVNERFNRHALGLDLKDVNWVKIFKTRAVRETPLALTSSLVMSELCAKLSRNGRYRPTEVPSRYCPRRAGKARGGSPLTLLRAAREVARLWWVVRRDHPEGLNRSREIEPYRYKARSVDPASPDLHRPSPRSGTSSGRARARRAKSGAAPVTPKAELTKVP